MAGSQTRDTVTLDEIIMVDTETLERANRARDRRARYENRHQGRKKNPNRVPNAERPFVAWDGEGPKDAGYALFGSSEGDEICHPYLETRECLDLILEREREIPNAIHVWFGSNYDVSMILRQLPWRHLSALKHFTKTIWSGYELEHIPHKWLAIKKDGVTAKVFDIQSFFGGSYVSALLDMKVGTDEEIAHLTSEKARRSEFLFSEIGEIRDYWRLELRLMPVLCNNLRATFLGAGFDVRSWHGPGSLANLAMRRHKVHDCMAESPAVVRHAARCAFAGGRFEMFRGGHIKRKVHNADIHSAYPAYARDLPNLSRGVWRTGRDYEADKFAVYKIRYRTAFDPLRPYPLYRRLSTGEVIWPHECEGWFWGPEAELVKNDPDAEFLESYIFDEDDATDRPFAWIEEYYLKRQTLKRIGSPLELTFKLIINSVYGQLAQRTGWDKKQRTSPKSHQLEWAGYITSACRAAVFRAAMSVGDNLISIDTDGVYSMAPFRNLDTGERLGQWDTESYDSGVFFQSGIYALGQGGDWVKGRTRGIPKGKYSAEEVLRCVNAGESLRMLQTKFTGYGLALNGIRESLNTWESVPVEVVFGGQGKRYHNTVKWCGKNGHCKDGIHEFIPRPVRFCPDDGITSAPHYLPWLANDPVVESKKRVVSDLAMFDINHLDEDEEWVMQYA
jgi:hypothetical protein